MNAFYRINPDLSLQRTCRLSIVRVDETERRTRFLSERKRDLYEEPGI
jgi:hypothetical protein